MPDFSHDYNDLLSYCGAVIRNHHLYQEDGSDILNNAFILFSESKQPYTKELFKKFIVRAALREKDSETYHSTAGNNFVQGDICCKKCKEVKSPSLFRFQKINGRVKYRSTCKACESELQMIRHKKNPGVRTNKSYRKYVPLALRASRKNKNQKEKKIPNRRIDPELKRQRRNRYLKEYRKRGSKSTPITPLEKILAAHSIITR